MIFYEDSLFKTRYIESRRRLRMRYSQINGDILDDAIIEDGRRSNYIMSHVVK